MRFEILISIQCLFYINFFFRHWNALGCMSPTTSNNAINQSRQVHPITYGHPNSYPLMSEWRYYSSRVSELPETNDHINHQYFSLEGTIVIVEKS